MTDDALKTELRAAGFSADALQYPRTAMAFVMFCAFNDTDPKAAPRAWGYFPNEATQAAWERVAVAAKEFLEIGR